MQILNLPKQTSSFERLKDSEIRYRRLFETAQDGILILDAKTGLITDVNPFLMELLNFSHEDFFGKELWEIGLFKDIEASKSAFLELQEKGYLRYDDLPLKTKSGRSVNVEFVSNVCQVNDDNIIQCNIRDITTRKYSERSEQRLRQSQRMEALGELAGGLAHDFNNLLGIILGYCELLQTGNDLSETTRMMLLEIHGAGTSAKNLTRHLLAFSRRQVLQPIFLDLNKLIDRTSTMLTRLIGDNVSLVSVLQPGLGTVKADPNQMEQLLMNLVINARDAMATGGKVTLETTNVQIDETCEQRHSIKPGAYVVLSVSDTGVGMNKEVQTRIFEPFFSTKGANKGTGLGLATVFGIVQQSVGEITVDSEPGKGATFKIYFPLRREAPTVVEPVKAMPLRGGSETILLVEDAAPLRSLTRRLLEGCGYQILDSGDPAEAVRIAQEYKGTLPLVITDVVMPGFSGPILAEKLVAARPGTRILYTSGFADDSVTPNGLVPNCAFLEKPFTRDALIMKVRELLDSGIDASIESHEAGFEAMSCTNV